MWVEDGTSRTVLPDPTRSRPLVNDFLHSSGPSQELEKRYSVGTRLTLIILSFFLRFELLNRIGERWGVVPERPWYSPPGQNKSSCPSNSSVCGGEMLPEPS